MLIIGIDPGQSGGVAFIGDNDYTPRCHKMPDTPLDFVELMRGNDLSNCHAFIERVGPMPKQGVVSVWTFANTFHGPQWAFAALKIPFELVRPQVWQKSMQCLTGGDKNVSKAKAQQLWPTNKWTHAIADAALIAEYGRRLIDR